MLQMSLLSVLLTVVNNLLAVLLYLEMKDPLTMITGDVLERQILLSKEYV